MLSGLVGKLDYCKRPSEYGAFAQLIDGGDLWTFRNDSLKNLVQFVVVVVLEFEPAVQRGSGGRLAAGQEECQTGE